jgi:arylsulfatase A-like enzyme
VVYAPGRVPENEVVHDVARITDVLPTILDLVDIPYDEDDFRGRSLLPLVRHGADSPRLAYSECPHVRIVHGRSIQSATEKLIDPGEDGQSPEYYDLTRDSRERHDLRSGQSSKVSELMAALNEISDAAMHSRAGHIAPQEEPSADTIRKLRSLGYTE